jgi:hypothetical protein
LFAMKNQRSEACMPDPALRFLRSRWLATLCCCPAIEDQSLVYWIVRHGSSDDPK